MIEPIGFYGSIVTTSGPVLHLSLPVSDLDAARRFYVDVLGCRVGRVRESWIDVWFFGMQLTLQLRPDEVRPSDGQGVRHFGVVLTDAESYRSLVDRVRSAGVGWLSEPAEHTDIALSGKVGGKLADPSGNVIEVKHYPDDDAYRAATSD
jgi:extradiol dioxygenase family protein